MISELLLLILVSLELQFVLMVKIMHIKITYCISIEMFGKIAPITYEVNIKILHTL